MSHVWLPGKPEISASDISVRFHRHLKCFLCAVRVEKDFSLASDPRGHVAVMYVRQWVISIPGLSGRRGACGERSQRGEQGPDPREN